MAGRVLILGASGRFGRNAAEAFWNAGWRVREFNRSTDDLIQASAGVDIIVNGWNPPYTHWARDVPRLTKQVIAAAKASGATIILPGNIYGYGRDAGPILGDASPMAARNPLGRIRIEMEAAYKAAPIQTIVLRGGDFIDTEASGNWFDKIIVAKAAKGRIVSPGDPEVPHAWAYLPDLARAAVALASRRDDLTRFETVLFPGYTLSLQKVASLVEAATGRPQTVERLNWAPIRIASPFWPMGRKLLEMRYLWSMPHDIDGSRFAALLPEFRATDPLTAMTKALRHLEIDPDQPVTRRQARIAAE
ncbi:MAG: epimerase [Alphaproteobacteria bacterium]|nr:epimerase [Alphaproteobacteria bacterium]